MKPQKGEWWIVDIKYGNTRTRKVMNMTSTVGQWKEHPEADLFWLDSEITPIERLYTKEEISVL